MQHSRYWKRAIVMAAMLLFPLSAAMYGQDTGDIPATKLLLGQKMKITGFIVSREPGTFVLRDDYARTFMVALTEETEIRESKKNPFRGARHYAADELVRGLNVEVEGRGDDFGRLVAQKIRFTHTEFRIATAVESRVIPVEDRLSETEGRLLESEDNARHLSGQIDELNAISAQVGEDARAAQDTADEALAGLKAVNRLVADTNAETNERISALDEFEVMTRATIHFKAGSALLSDEAKQILKGIAEETESEKGYVIEVAGFASSDGDAAFNKILSERRAATVVDFLAVDGKVPLRRIVIPFGFGENLPVADNSTTVGREQNRRVEVRVLVSRGQAEGARISLVNQR